MRRSPFFWSKKIHSQQPDIKQGQELKIDKYASQLGTRLPNQPSSFSLTAAR